MLRCTRSPRPLRMSDVCLPDRLATAAALLPRDGPTEEGSGLTHRREPDATGGVPILRGTAIRQSSRKRHTFTERTLHRMFSRLASAAILGGSARSVTRIASHSASSPKPDWAFMTARYLMH